MIEGVKPGEGQVLLALYANAETWLKPDQAFRQAVMPCPDDGGELSVDWPDCPAGTYACCLLVDRNSNLQMDLNLAGFPMEDFAFSNPGGANFGPPSFERASFVHGLETTVRLSLR